MPKEPGITQEVIEELRRRGMNQSEIAEATGFTRQHISKMKRKTDRFYKPPRQIANEKFPWTVGKKHNENPIGRKLRMHGEYMESGGRGMNDDKLRRVLNLYWELQERDAVVEFHPDIPPSDESRTGGFAYRPREESDGHLLIRVNDLVEIDRGTIEETWTWPERLPQRNGK